jgi:hypothetical protein
MVDAVGDRPELRTTVGSFANWGHVSTPLSVASWDDFWLLREGGAAIFGRVLSHQSIRSPRGLVGFGRCAQPRGNCACVPTSGRNSDSASECR